MTDVKWTRTLSILAGGLGLCVTGLARAQNTTPVSGQDTDTQSHVQSETACAVSVFDDREVEVIAANDFVEGGGITYTDTNRYILDGASQMGWYYRERTGTDPNPPWQHGRLSPESAGVLDDVAVIWSDPGLASAPDRPDIVLMGYLMVPRDKFPDQDPSPTECGSVGCIVDTLKGECGARAGGICMARSLTGGVNFDMLQCFKDTSPGACNTGDEFDSTNGHFWDGIDIAIGSGENPVGYVATFDTTQREVLWQTEDAAASSAQFTPVVDDTGPMGQVGDVSGDLSVASHMRIQLDGFNNLWRMTSSAPADTSKNLKVAVLGRNADAVVLAENLVMDDKAFFSDVPHGVNDPGGRLAATVQLGPQYAFDLGKNEAGEDEMRFVYVAETEFGNYFVQAGRCTPDLATCETPFQWRTETHDRLTQFHPNIKYGFDETEERHIWKVSFYELNEDRTEVAIFAGDLAMLDSTGEFVPASLRASAVTDPQVPCPDERGTVEENNGSFTTNDPGDYWGDYDDMFFNRTRCSFTRPFTDSSQGCDERRKYTSVHQHVSAVEIPCCTGDRLCGGACCVSEQQCVDEAESNCALPSETRVAHLVGTLDFELLEAGQVEGQGAMFPTAIDETIILSPSNRRTRFDLDAHDTIPGSINATFELAEDNQTIDVPSQGFSTFYAQASNLGPTVAAGEQDDIGGRIEDDLPTSMNQPYVGLIMEWHYTVFNESYP